METKNLPQWRWCIQDPGRTCFSNSCTHLRPISCKLRRTAFCKSPSSLGSLLQMRIDPLKTRTVKVFSERCLLFPRHVQCRPRPLSKGRGPKSCSRPSSLKLRRGLKKGCRSLGPECFRQYGRREDKGRVSP